MHIHDTSGPAAMRCEPDERSPYPLSLGLGIQAALLVFPAVALVFGAKGALGLRAPVIALVAGCAAAAFSGMYQGGLAVILLTIIMELTGPRRYSVATVRVSESDND